MGKWDSGSKSAATAAAEAAAAAVVSEAALLQYLRVNVTVAVVLQVAIH